MAEDYGGWTSGPSTSRNNTSNGRKESSDIEIIFEKEVPVISEADWERIPEDNNEEWPDLDLAIAESLCDDSLPIFYNPPSTTHQKDPKQVVSKPVVKYTPPASIRIPKPMKLVDEAWELIDPTPDIFALFVEFSKEFFWNKLGGVEVKWSKRMTSCAGTCSFKPKSRECLITLSEPLLKLRPRKDLVETLLHEMIHAYLFLDYGTTDREGHGEQFHSHMYRINNKAGTKISVYHSFIDEVKHYQTHWWKCDGPCRNRPPYFGIVKRAMNRAPGPSDIWHEEHKKNCGGTFIKIREPTKEAAKERASGSSKNSDDKSKKITDFFPTTPKKKSTDHSSSTNANPFRVPDQQITTMKDITAIATNHIPSSSSSSSSQYSFPGVGRKLSDVSKPDLSKKWKF